MRATGAIVMLAAVLAICGGTAAGAVSVYWKDGVAGDWSTPTNWEGNALPVAGEWPRINDGGSVQITSDVNLPGSNIWTQNTDWSILQTAGIVDARSLYLSNPKAGPNGIYRLEGGELNLTYWMNLAWNNTSNAVGHFVQAGGSVSVPNVGMCIKSSTQEAYYDLEDGTFTAGNLYVGRSGANQTAVFTQTDGMAFLTGGITLGAVAGTTGQSIYNLDGGELTIAGGTPFTFTQPGAPAYFDFDGGVLNLLGDWDFAKLTAIADSDFRVAGVAATAGDLAFTPVVIGDRDFTAISAVDDIIPEPATLSLLGLGALALLRRRRRR